MRYALFMNAVHDLQQSIVHFFLGPGYSHGILALLKTRNRNATRIRGLCRTEQNSIDHKLIHRVQFRRHVRTFGNHLQTIANQLFGIREADLILSRTWKGDFAWDGPWSLAGIKLS